MLSLNRWPSIAPALADNPMVRLDRICTNPPDLHRAFTRKSFSFQFHDGAYASLNSTRCNFSFCARRNIWSGNCTGGGSFTAAGNSPVAWA